MTASAAYWEARYQVGGTSGAGSYGRLSRFKAGFINAFIESNAVQSVIDLGCGDGNLLSLLRVRGYTGADVSATVLARCAGRFPQHRFVPFDALERVPPAELAMSIDVIFHLIEDAVFADYMDTLFAQAGRFVLIYASNANLSWPSPHVRHRCFTDHAAARFPAWRLAAHVPNRFPFDPLLPDETSFADFYVYTRANEPVSFEVPAAS